MAIVPDPKKAHLRYISDTTPGYSRQKMGHGFTYFYTNGKRITDPIVRDRIEKLAIPPAWTNVWICSVDYGHIQATGQDEKGRKQYVYHPEWSKLSQDTKFQKLTSFAEILPPLRREIRGKIAERGLTKDKVIATIIWLLQKTFIRVGNIEYAKENNSYGLTTMRPKHVDVVGDTIQFEFMGKSGKRHKVDVTHPRVARTIRKLEELPGYELFQYVDDGGERHTITSEEVNDYLKSVTGDDITAKDFRTWGGTVIGAESLYDLGVFSSETVAKKNIVQAVKQVSLELGNTTAVCRSYYIHPTVIESYEKEILIPHFEKIKKNKEGKPDELTVGEFATFTLLKKYK
jgi:DNA topoisomerase-1